jgi:hemerythrin
MKEKNVVQWQNSYSVNIRLIDEQHMELIRLTNKLFASCMGGQQKSTVVFLDIIHSAVEYTGYHFSTEEKIMERINFPEYAAHRKEHKDFVREVYQKVEDFKAGKNLAPLTFVYFLRDWILQHVAVRDRKLGDYLVYLKRSGELKNMTMMVKKDETAQRVYIR